MMRACSFSPTSGRACACCVAIWPAAWRTCSMLVTNLRRSGSQPGVHGLALASRPRPAPARRAGRGPPLDGGRARLARTWGAPLRSARPCERRDWPEGRAWLALLEEAVDVLTNSPAKLEHAKARTELGRHFGVPVAAPRRASSCDARSSWQRSAAPRPRRARRDRASRHWGAARHAALSGVRSLTPSERRVAQMAAEGPNREIAQAPLRHPEDGRGPPLERLPQARIRSRSQLPEALAQPSRG